MKRRRLMIALLTLSFITSVTTIVALMITAVHLATGPTPNPTTTVSTEETKTSTTSTTHNVQSSTTTTAPLTTTINLDELLCDDWLCNWKGRFWYEHIHVIIITLVKYVKLSHFPSYPCSLLIYITHSQATMVLPNHLRRLPDRNFVQHPFRGFVLGSLPRQTTRLCLLYFHLHEVGYYFLL